MLSIRVCLRLKPSKDLCLLLVCKKALCFVQITSKFKIMVQKCSKIALFQIYVSILQVPHLMNILYIEQINVHKMYYKKVAINFFGKPARFQKNRVLNRNNSTIVCFLALLPLPRKRDI